jgi:ribonuclease-3
LTTPEVPEEFRERLGVAFAEPGLLARALVHRSYAFENGLLPNERLEFLGDAVLALVVTDEIFHLQPDAQEGRLAKVRAAAVKTSSLAAVARELGLGEFVLLGKGEAASGGSDKDSILADTLEAVIGAYYLDQGYEAAYDLVHRMFAQRIADVVGSRSALDFKTALQELAAARFNTLPVYDVTDEGPDHAKTFTAVVSVGGRAVGDGAGRNKKQAEQRAARVAHGHLVAELEAAGEDPPPRVEATIVDDPTVSAGTGGTGGTSLQVADGGFPPSG